MPLTSMTFLRFLLLAFLLLSTTGGAAQERNDHGDATPTVVTTQQLRDLHETLRGSRERLASMVEAVDTEPAQAWLDASPLERLTERADATVEDSAEHSLWQNAVEQEMAGGERLRGALDRAALALSAEQRLEDAGQRMAEMLDAPLPVEEGRGLTRIEEDIADLDRRRTRVLLEQDQTRQTLERLEAQARTQAETLERLGRERDAEPETPWGPLEEAELADALAAWEQARARQAQARIIAAQLDSQTLGPRMEILGLEQRALETEAQWLDQRLRQLTAELAERSGEELRALRNDIRRLTERDPEAAERFSPEIDSLLQRIDRIAWTQARVRVLQEQRDYYVQLEADLSQTQDSVRERLEIGGLTDVLGGLLMEEERRLRRLRDLGFVLRDLERELVQSRLHAITLRDELRSLPPAPPHLADDRTQAEFRRLQREVIGIELQADEQLTEELRQTETRLRAVVLRIDELTQVLRESLLWWPSHQPVGVAWATAVPAALMALLDPAAWEEIHQALIHVTIGSPTGTLLTLLVVAGLFIWGRGAPAQLARLAEKAAHRFTDRMGLTFQAMGWSLLRALPVPTLLTFTAFRLQGIPDIGAGVEVLAVVLFLAAVWWLTGHLFLLFTGKHGVGMVHFQWSPLVVERLRRHVGWYMPALLLLIMSLALVFAHPSELVFDVFGRAGLLAATFLSGLFAWRMLAPRRASEATEFQERRRRLVRIALSAFALVLIGLLLGGYLLTVGALLGRTINTVILVGGVWLGYSLAARALVLSETRLVMRRMREEREKAAAMEGSAVVGEGAVIDMPEPNLSVENINYQTRILLRVATGAALVLGLFWIWADILPALTWLERVTLWSRTIAVGDTEILSRVSLQDFLLAIFLGVVFMLAARNLPGLVEILLSRSTGMDASGRYTVTALVRYVLAVVAVITVFSLLGLRWNELQWMVAALSVGLGFGLQEVVANFVSGIIILFERPVRVGDTITIGEYSGTVARIRTRATTIVDWDNREIVVPNKTFITERLINWTLSDTMTRIVIPVGVSYDADVDDVMSTLKTIAEESPLVLDEPPPNVLFLHFGDSALSFELRVYVNQMKDRLVTVSELHRTIIKEFRKKGIEIAFPQMDLHIRDVASEKGNESGGPAQPPNPGR
jgi:potassium-dependent mechanosensitive channel